MNKGLFTSNSHEWETPQELYDELNAEFHFTLDPCASHHNAKCEMYWTEHDDGLKKPWWYWIGNKKGYHHVFMNPPYGRQIGKWIKKAWEESQKGCLVVCLLPARTDTKWFHDYCKKGEIRFLKGRIYFSMRDIWGNKLSGRAPFPSMIVIFRGNQ